MRRARLLTAALLLALSGALVATLTLAPVGSTVLVGLARLSAAQGSSVLSDTELDRPSYLLSSNGTVLATFEAQDRDPVPLSHVAPVVLRTLISTEDRTFFHNDGVSLRAVLRAALADLTHHALEGGSTLTEQYAKNLAELHHVPGADADTLRRKLVDALAARELTLRETKDQILDGYLNTVYFGAGAYGIEAAAERYFSTSARHLNLAQAALLVGLVESPSLYDPFVNPRLARDVRRHVLLATYDNHEITNEQFRRADAAPLGLNPSVPSTGCASSLVPYVCDAVSAELLRSPALGRTKQQRRAIVALGGLVIHTTLNLTQQKLAEQTLDNTLSPTGRVGAALVTVTPGTGAVTAMAENRVDGTNTALNETTLNYATSPSPVGSTFKIFTLATALNEGLPLTATLPGGATYHSPTLANPPSGYYTNADPSNAVDLSLAQATDQSVNTAFVQLEERVGVLSIARTARAMGLDNLPLRGPGRVHANEGSLTLGARAFTPLQMAAVYAGVAAHGLYCSPTLLASIRWRTGKSIAIRPHCHQALTPAVAATLTSLLRGVVTSGTGTAANVPGQYVAGKTGTTSNYGAAWFDGYTPAAATAVWVGDPRGPSYPLLNVDGVAEVYGGTIPAEIFRTYETQILQHVTPTPVPPPGSLYLAGSSIVPDVLNLPVRRATTYLERAGYVPRVSSSPASATVTSEVPAPGTALAPGATVEVNS